MLHTDKFLLLDIPVAWKITASNLLAVRTFSVSSSKFKFSKYKDHDEAF